MNANPANDVSAAASHVCRCESGNLQLPGFSGPAGRLCRMLFAAGVALGGTVSASAQSFTLTRLVQPSGTAGYSADAMNNAGQVVVNASVKSGRKTVAVSAMVWENGSYTTLPALPGASASVANDISDTGVVVAQS